MATAPAKSSVECVNCIGFLASRVGRVIFADKRHPITGLMPCEGRKSGIILGKGHARGPHATSVQAASSRENGYCANQRAACAVSVFGLLRQRRAASISASLAP